MDSGEDQTFLNNNVMKVCDTYIDPERKIFPEYPAYYPYCPWCGKKQL